MQPGVRTLTSAQGERFTFDPGALCLELLLTGGPGAYRRWESLHEPADLAGWVTGSRLVQSGPLAVRDVTVRPADLTAVKRLRDTLWTVAPALAHGRPVDEADLAVINESAAAGLRPRVDPATRARCWVIPVTGAQVLGALARDAIDLVAGVAGAGRVRECAADDCNLVFIDTSRPANRRWCSMERCGNRNKVRIHRARRVR